MGHSHAHSHGPDRAQSRRALLAVLALTSVFTVVEIVAGVLSGSLALIADAGHMLSDSLSLGVALFAIWLAERPPTPNRSFGYQRAEILAALANGVTLVAISVWIFIEAAGRFGDPPDVAGSTMLIVAVVGLLVNAIGARILWRSGAESLNMSAALRHVFADLLGSLGVIVAALVILATGWLYADPLVSVLIGLLILGSSWGVLRDATRVLIEASPAGLDATEVGTSMADTDGVVEVHDLHLWEVTSGFPALSAHVLANPEADCPALRLTLERELAEGFGIEHTTLQIENVPPKLIQIEDT